MTDGGSSDTLIEVLPWDSEHFGCRIARAVVHRLTEETVAAVVARAERDGVECLYFLADPDDPETIRLAEGHRFHLVDVRVTLDRSGSDDRPAPNATADAPPIRTAEEVDLAALRALARTSHHDSRFYHDLNFPRDLCDRLYERWIENSVGGWADAVLVAGERGRPVGYVTCHLDADGSGRIGLVAIVAEAARRGLGLLLVKAASDWFGRRHARGVQVVTQGRNLAAQRLYLRAGFLPIAIQLWYHRWAADGPAATDR